MGKLGLGLHQEMENNSQKKDSIAAMLYMVYFLSIYSELKKLAFYVLKFYIPLGCRTIRTAEGYLPCC